MLNSKRWQDLAILARQALFFLGLATLALAACGYVWTQRPLRASAAMERKLARNVGRIMTLDELLTMSARMAASSRDRGYEERYLAHVEELDKLINSTVSIVPDAEVVDAVHSTDKANQRLVEMEMRSFELDGAGLYEEAAQLLANEAYRSDKVVYANGMGRAFARLEKLTSLRTESVERWAALLQIAAVTSLMLVLAAWTLEQRERRRRTATYAAELEATIERRTRELEAAHARLLEGARQAGMAEVAIGVLHNVGNVLNSVNVSASLIDKTVRTSRTPDLLKITALLKANEKDLGAYIAADRKGKLLPAYLTSLAEHMVSEHAELTKELGSLTRSVDHIKQIVAAHQAYGRPSRLTEMLDPVALMEDALRIGSDDLVRQDVRVERNYGKVAAINVDKHKLLQIMVNLVKNARAALEASQTPQRNLEVTVDRDAEDESKLILQVRDNGVGIAPENMSRLFEHGFTTKDTGNGFGLHGAALAARALGGAIHAHSNGRGTGATFTLSIPLGVEGRASL